MNCYLPHPIRSTINVSLSQFHLPCLFSHRSSITVLEQRNRDVALEEWGRRSGREVENIFIARCWFKQSVSNSSMKLLMKHFTIYWMKFHGFHKVSVTGLKMLIILPRHLHCWVHEKARREKIEQYRLLNKNEECTFNNKSSYK